MDREALNMVYRKLDEKCRAICERLQADGFDCTYAYYNGHYLRNAQGEYEMDYFPIPVISVKALCDIEIWLDQISVAAKLTREAALSFDYALLDGRLFEAYGVDDYLNDFRTEGEWTEIMLDRIRASAEAEIGFSFPFEWEVGAEAFGQFAWKLCQWGFFY